MIYVGVVADLMGIDPAEIEKAIAKQLKGKQKAVDLNVSAVKLGLEYAAAELPGQDPVPRRAHERDGGKDHRRGQHGRPPSAASSAAPPSARGTPSRRPPRSARPSSTSATTCASTPPRRRRTSPSSRPRTRSPRSAWCSAPGGRAPGRSRPRPVPGISLMSEYIGLGYYAEIPAVIFDIQRTGPSTGLPTRTMQGDLLLCYFSSHGDSKHPAALPRLARGVLHDGAAGLRPRRAAPDAGLRDVGPRPRHEQLDVGPVPVSDGAAPPRQGARRRGHREGEGHVGPVQGRGRRRHPVPDAARHARTRTPRTSRAAPATTRGRSTPRSRRTTSTT